MLCNVYRAIIASVCLSVSLSVPFPIILRRRIRIKAEKKIRMKQASLVTNRHWMRTYTKHSTVPYTSLICNKKNYIRPTPNLWKREKKRSHGVWLHHLMKKERTMKKQAQKSQVKSNKSTNRWRGAVAIYIKQCRRRHCNLYIRMFQ